MIVGVRGTLEATGVDSAVVQLGGFSLRLFVPASTLNRLGAVGEPIHLLTHLHVREDALALYGFATDDELHLFELLLTVSGIGPRVALALLSGASPEALRAAIASGDVDQLTRIPGIGKKLAGRIALELKGKLPAAPGAPAVPAASAEADVFAALTGLGYSPADAQAAIRSLPADASLSTEEKIILALRSFARPS